MQRISVTARLNRSDLQFEEAALATLGFAYEQRPRLSGGAYAPILRKVDGFLDRKLSSALAS